MQKLALMAAVAACLSGCAARSTLSGSADDRRPTTSASVLADCASPVEIPRDPPPDLQHQLWAADRLALADCKALNRAKGRALAAAGLAPE
ncbi:hypothetical protein [Rhizobium paknamense]|uniref:hypothetical protein n=1 Tax=Rhizobium paknamense TaxID=1206817 RepID=UPI0035EF3F34